MLEDKGILIDYLGGCSASCYNQVIITTLVSDKRSKVLQAEDWQGTSAAFTLFISFQKVSINSAGNRLTPSTSGEFSC